MGLFSWLSIGPSSIDKRLEREFVPMLQTTMGLPPSEARKKFHEMLSRTKQAAHAEGTTALPERYGDLMLQQEPSHENVKALLAKARKDGATDADIRHWWNMHDLERRMIMELDALVRMSRYVSLRQKGMQADEATLLLKQFHAHYGDPDDSKFDAGDDRLLPYELRDRIKRWNSKQANASGNLNLGELRTFNALVRREIRQGNI